jgi:hypothetical protein
VSSGILPPYYSKIISAIPNSDVTFSPEQQDCLMEIEPTLQGKTKKQQNPYPRASLPWATWIIARLGGASGTVLKVCLVCQPWSRVYDVLNPSLKAGTLLGVNLCIHRSLCGGSSPLTRVFPTTSKPNILGKICEILVTLSLG